MKSSLLEVIIELSMPVATPQRSQPKIDDRADDAPGELYATSLERVIAPLFQRKACRARAAGIKIQSVWSRILVAR